MEIPKTRKLFTSSEERQDYLMKKLKVLKKLELEVLKMEMELLREWRRHTPNDNETRRWRNSSQTQTTGKDSNSWCSTRPR